MKILNKERRAISFGPWKRTKEHGDLESNEDVGNIDNA